MRITYKFYIRRSYGEVLPYFMKSQKSEVKKYKNTPYSNRDGELWVENPPFR